MYASPLKGIPKSYGPGMRGTTRRTTVGRIRDLRFGSLGPVPPFYRGLRSVVHGSKRSFTTDLPHRGGASGHSLRIEADWDVIPGGAALRAALISVLRVERGTHQGRAGQGVSSCARRA